MSRFINAELESDLDSDSVSKLKSDAELMAKQKSGFDSEKFILLSIIFLTSQKLNNHSSDFRQFLVDISLTLGMSKNSYFANFGQVKK